MKFREVQILAEAADDLVSAKKFYSQQEAWLGEYFTESIMADLASLHLYAGIHRRVNGFYRLTCRRFPFAIYYDITNDIATVAAILDMRRRPTWITKSLIARSTKRPR